MGLLWSVDAVWELDRSRDLQEQRHRSAFTSSFNLSESRSCAPPFLSVAFECRDTGLEISIHLASRTISNMSSGSFQPTYEGVRVDGEGSFRCKCGFPMRDYKVQRKDSPYLDKKCMQLTFPVLMDEG
jgi:hypothetical protein